MFSREPEETTALVTVITFFRDLVKSFLDEINCALDE